MIFIQHTQPERVSIRINSSSSSSRINRARVNSSSNHISRDSMILILIPLLVMMSSLLILIFVPTPLQDVNILVILLCPMRTS